MQGTSGARRIGQTDHQTESSADPEEFLLVCYPGAEGRSWSRPDTVDMFCTEGGHDVMLCSEYRNRAEGTPGIAATSDWKRFVCVQSVLGPAVGVAAPWRYVVETDVDPDRENDFNAWYQDEHLPGLAAVPGVVRATRYVLEVGSGPRYRASYDLALRESFNSPPWLVVRGSPWSSRVRPAFRSTTRTMYHRLSAGIRPAVRA